MKNRTIGILAHVDAGKTTLSEQILYRTGAVRTLGRIDQGTTQLDADPIERTRGITVFSDQSEFQYAGQRYTLIDTPGHVDFAPEAERALLALDAAILLIDSTGGVRPHTLMLSRMARRQNLPLMVFLNKCDLAASDVSRALAELRARMEGEPILLPPDPEAVAELDETFLETYLSGDFDDSDVWQALRRAFLAGTALPILSGSALNGEGVETLLDTLNRLLPDGENSQAVESPLDAVVYKVRRDTKGRRVTFVKLLSGTLHARDAFQFGDQTEKIHEIRLYKGTQYEPIDVLMPGDVAGLTGLSVPRCGDRLCIQDGERTRTQSATFEAVPALAAKVTSLDGASDSALIEKFRLLEDEEMQLGLSYDAQTHEILIRVMGPMQLEVLEQMILNRYNMKVAFSSPKVVYLETIAEPVMGYGHYEPLRHYAEANLLLEPAPRGRGISFESRCHVDDLSIGYQSAIRTHVFERIHRGVLTGSPLTDVHISLIAGRAHIKHTEGGDFREATYRAIRQGLMCAKSVLLEPFYRFEIFVPDSLVGRVMSDLLARSASFDSPEIVEGIARLCGRGPVASLADYGLEIRAFTHGEGSAIFQMEGYDLCHNVDEVIQTIGYNPDADREQPSSSVFCSHGAGVLIPWNEAERHMHCPNR